MITRIIPILLVVVAVFRMTGRAEDGPLVSWGQPVHEWNLGISTTNAVFPQGVPPQVSLLLSNGANVPRKITSADRNYRYQVVWSEDSGEVFEKLYPYPLHPGGSAKPRSVSINETWLRMASCGNILARLPPGQGRLIAIRDVIGPNGWEELYSGSLVLRVRPRIESDPPPLPAAPITKEEVFAEEIARGRAARAASNATASNLIPSQTSPGIPTTIVKSGTPSIGQNSGTAASPVIATVSAGESPGSVFTPRNIIGATVVLALLAIIGTVLLRARSRQNPPP